MSKVRLLKLVVQPVVVLDDGVHLAAGPTLAPFDVYADGLLEFPARILAEIADLERSLSTPGEPDVR